MVSALEPINIVTWIFFFLLKCVKDRHLKGEIHPRVKSKTGQISNSLACQDEAQINLNAHLLKFGHFKSVKPFRISSTWNLSTGPNWFRRFESCSCSRWTELTNSTVAIIWCVSDRMVCRTYSSIRSFYSWTKMQLIRMESFTNQKYKAWIY